MARSHRPGTCSSPPVLTDSEVEAKLRVLAQTSFVADIIGALGKDAGTHLVGGTVRDLLCGVEQFDVDMACALPVNENMRRLETKGIRVIETGLKHGTITALSAGNPVEITAFRHPADRAGAAPANSIAEDLAGRDFTINAIAYCVSSGRLVDPHGGRKDLQAGVLRCVGDAQARFEEDPLRLLRLIRFGPCAGRTVEDSSAHSAKLLAPSLSHVSVERIREEFVRILASVHADEGLRAMLNMGLLEQVLPELLPAVGFEQNTFHTQDVFEHTLSVIMRCPPSGILRLAALFHDIGKPGTLSLGADGMRHFYLHECLSEKICTEVMERLRFSNQDTRDVTAVVRHHMRPLDCGPSGVRRLMRDLADKFEDWRTFKIADSPPVMASSDFEKQLQSFDALLAAERERLKGAPYGKLAVDGYDLITLGVKPGAYLGNLLKQLEEIVIEDPQMNDKEILLGKAKEFIKAGI